MGSLPNFCDCAGGYWRVWGRLSLAGDIWVGGCSGRAPEGHQPEAPTLTHSLLYASLPFWRGNLSRQT